MAELNPERRRARLACTCSVAGEVVLDGEALREGAGAGERAAAPVRRLRSTLGTAAPGWDFGRMRLFVDLRPPPREAPPGAVPRPAAAFDVLVCAGDIWEGEPERGLRASSTSRRAPGARRARQPRPLPPRPGRSAPRRTTSSPSSARRRRASTGSRLRGVTILDRAERRRASAASPSSARPCGPTGPSPGYGRTARARDREAAGDRACDGSGDGLARISRRDPAPGRSALVARRRRSPPTGAARGACAPPWRGGRGPAGRRHPPRAADRDPRALSRRVPACPGGFRPSTARRSSRTCRRRCARTSGSPAISMPRTTRLRRHALRRQPGRGSGLRSGAGDRGRGCTWCLRARHCHPGAAQRSPGPINATMQKKPRRPSHLSEHVSGYGFLYLSAVTCQSGEGGFSSLGSGPG